MVVDVATVMPVVALSVVNVVFSESLEETPDPEDPVCPL